MGVKEEDPAKGRIEMFGKQATATEATPERVGLMMTSTMTLPWNYMPLGLVMHETQHFFRAGLKGLMAELESDAAKMGAKGVIGINVGMNTTGNNSTSRVWAFGTAVTWENPA